MLTSNRWRVRSVMFCMCAAITAALQGTAIAADSPFSSAMTAWHSGDLSRAHQLMSDEISRGSRDPRLLYFRGILNEQMGAAGQSDFEAAAALEIATQRSGLVDASLERVQGPLRTRIEEVRATVRASQSEQSSTAANAIPDNSSSYRRAVAAFRSGDTLTSEKLLTAAAARGSLDPRIYYFLGASKLRNGNSDAAMGDFRKAISLEQNAGDVARGNAAVQLLPDDIRQVIEEQVKIGDGAQVRSRRQHVHQILRRDRLVEAERFRQQQIQQQQLIASRAEAERDQSATEESNSGNEQSSEAMEEETPNDAPSEDTQPSTDDSGDTGAGDPAPQDNDAQQTPAPAESESAAAPEPATDAEPIVEPTEESESTPAAAEDTARDSSAESAAADSIDFSWLSPSSELIVYVRPSAMAESEFSAAVMELPIFASAMSATSSTFADLQPSDIQSVTFGMGDVMATVMAAAMQARQPGAAGGGMSELMKSQTAVVVVRLNRDADIAAALTGEGGELKTHGGREYFLMPAKALPAGAGNGAGEAASAPPAAVLIADSRTLLISQEAGLQAAIDRGPGEVANTAFAFLNPSSHCVIGFTSPALTAISGSIPTPENMPPFVGELVEAIKGQLSAVAISLSTTRDLNLQIQLHLTDSAAAEKAVKALQGGVEMLNLFYPGLKAQVPEPLQASVDQTISSVSASVDGSAAVLSVTLPQEIVTAVRDNPDLLPAFPNAEALPSDESPQPSEFGQDPPTEDFSSDPAIEPLTPAEGNEASDDAPAESNPFGDSPAAEASESPEAPAAEESDGNSEPEAVEPIDEQS
ncbi:MAG: hypothetical protein ACK526_21900 [Planctomyces sp.]